MAGNFEEEAFAQGWDDYKREKEMSQFGRFCQNGLCQKPPAVRTENGGEYCEEHATRDLEDVLRHIAQGAINIEEGWTVIQKGSLIHLAMHRLCYYTQRDRNTIRRLLDKMDKEEG